jgi:alkylated DNA repair protein (DNA oxidative demethylase)
MPTPDLFTPAGPPAPLPLGPAACVLPGFALARDAELLACIRAIEAQAPFRQMVTPGGFTMSVAMTNCGQLGWVTDRTGYRYTAHDPQSGKPWPAMPLAFTRLAVEAAAAAGAALSVDFGDFAPDACLINRYTPGTRLTLHQDRNERDFSAPIVSVSLGMDATFLFGNAERAGRVARVPLQHGDVVVWGGEDRLRFHGVAPLKDAPHARLGSVRINLTFRKAG